MAGFRWSEAKERAAVLVAEDDLTNAEIAAEAGVTRAALDKWKAHPAFAERVAAVAGALRAEALRQGIAQRHRRVRALVDRQRRMLRVIEARAAEMADECAGGDTGLLVRTYKILGSGRNAETVREYALDTGLLRELREHEKQAAQELGQWVEKAEVTLRAEARRIAREFGLSEDEVVAEADAILARRA